MKNKVMLAVLLISLLFISGCDSKIKIDNGFLREKHEITVFDPVSKKNIRTNLKGKMGDEVIAAFIVNGTFRGKKVGKKTFFIEESPYTPYFYISLKINKDHGLPKNLTLENGSISIFTKDDNYNKFDLAGLKASNTIKADDIVRLEYTDNPRLNKFISENIIHSQIKKIVTKIKFIGEYADGSERIYYSESVLKPYQREKKINMHPESFYL